MLCRLARAGDEIEAIKANQINTGSEAPDVIDVGLSFGPSATFGPTPWDCHRTVTPTPQALPRRTTVPNLLLPPPPPAAHGRVPLGDRHVCLPGDADDGEWRTPSLR